ncbi:hypothetical protein L218DRAFT_967940 [Marasmius fiardii PR-910]|nr:hypothetical protein L218DRAFT_967940 [Marasmius fiardii PR-910]
MEQKPAVLIVGSGPSGLVMALTLLRNGIPVRIIEKQASIRTPGQKGSGIQPRTQELYHFLGILPQILEKSGGRAPLFQIHTAPEGEKPIKVFEMHEKLEATPDRPLPNTTVLGQQPHEEVLRTVLEKDYGCTVEVNTALISFEQHPEHESVSVLLQKPNGERENTDVSWVVGADGAHSVVRKQLGLSFLGETREGEKFVIGDIFVKGGLEGRFCRSWGTNADRQINLLTFEKHTDRYTFICGGINLDHDKMASSREAWIETFYDVTGRKDIEFGDVIWMGTWRANIRMANKFGQGRVFIIGDAAHVHPPTGAQGLNSCIQDAINLAWKLALVHKFLSPMDLLDTYTTERVPVIATMLGLTTELLNKTYKADTDNAGLGRPGEMRQLGVNYRGSRIVVDRLGEPERVDPYRSGLDGGVIRAGDRTPDAPGLVEVSGATRVERLFDVFKVDSHTILVFGKENLAGIGSWGYPRDIVQTVIIYPQGAVVDEGAPTVDYAFVDESGFAYEHYGMKDRDGVLVVRPDGYVGAVVDGMEGVKEYFGRILHLGSN